MMKLRSQSTYRRLLRVGAVWMVGAFCVLAFDQVGLASDVIETAITNVLVDQPELAPAPSGWAYPHTPGTYFWAGFGFTFLCGMASVGSRWTQVIIEE